MVASLALSLEDVPLETLLECVCLDAFFVHDHQGRFRFVNSKACASVGYRRDELLAMTVMDIEMDFDLASAQAAWVAMRPGVDATLYGHQRRKDGTIVPVEARFGVLEASGERLYFATVTNITERLRTESTLRDNFVNLRSAFDAMAEGVVLQDRHGHILDANAGAEAILSLTRDQMLGKTSLDPDWKPITNDGQPFPGERHPAMTALRTGQPVRGCLMGIRSTDGGVRWLNVNSQPVMTTDEVVPTAVVTTFVDITQERQATLALEVARADLQAVLDHVPARIA